MSNPENHTPPPEFQLPVITPPTGTGEPRAPTPRRRGRAWFLHLLRVAMFVTTLAMIRIHFQRQLASAESATPALSIDDVRELFPTAASLSPEPARGNSIPILDADSEPLGYVVQTSPESDAIIGFSGPTNVLIGFDKADRVVGSKVLWSRDTREHLDMILADGRLLAAWKGKSWEGLAEHLSKPETAQVDAVSGATLTSLAIAESVALRLTGERPTSLKFPNEIKIEEVQRLIETADRLVPSDKLPGLIDVLHKKGTRQGRVLRTSPAADNITGFKGPTDTLIVFDEPDEKSTPPKVIGIRLRHTFDNESPDNPASDYVGYVRSDESFLSLFNGRTLAELASLDPFEEQVEGVSGATMTSMAVAEGIVAAARSAMQKIEQHKKMIAETLADETRNEETLFPSIHWSWRTAVSSVIVAIGISIGFFKGILRRGYSRRFFQLAVIVLLGVVNGDLLSQAVLVGWAQSGVPWQFAPGLVMVVAAALLVPMVSKQQPYCQHICPHGAVQQILVCKTPWQWKVPRRIHLLLNAIPVAFLALVILIPLAGWPLSLVDLEPFDAWVIGLAGVAAATIAIVGLVASLFVPMAYCRYGCPTGALLQFLRFHGRSDRLSIQDAAAAALTILAIGFVVLS